jgi:hypothetical protein
MGRAIGALNDTSAKIKRLEVKNIKNNFKKENNAVLAERAAVSKDFNRGEQAAADFPMWKVIYRTTDALDEALERHRAMAKCEEAGIEDPEQLLSKWRVKDRIDSITASL